MKKADVKRLLLEGDYALVSAARPDQTYAEASIATRSVGLLLRALGVDVIDCDGWYEGGPEPSLLIVRRGETYPSAVARAFEQACYIVRRSDSAWPASAECVFPDGERVAMNPTPVFMRGGSTRADYTRIYCDDGVVRFYFRTGR